MSDFLSYENEDAFQSALYPFKNQQLDAHFITHKGGRDENQDAFAMTQAKDGTLVFCVADGLGGHAGGKIASQVAVKTICNFAQTKNLQFYQPTTLVTAFQKANDAIAVQQQEIPEYSKMRSTLVVLLIKDDLAFWGHVGDVRLYLFRNNKVFFQTKDHSVPQMLADTGEISYSEIRHHPDGSSLLNSLGSKDKKIRVSLPLEFTQLRTNDCFNLSSDGYWQWLVEEDMIKYFAMDASMINISLHMKKHVLEHAKVKEKKHDNLTALNLKIKKSSINRSYWHKTRFLKGAIQ